MKYITIVLLVFSFQFVLAQNPERFQKEVENLQKIQYSFNSHKEIVVFAGSSSIRKWKNAATFFPQYNVVNTGFGGSQMSDLLFYSKPLILKYHPDIVFIYEGDNDLEYGKMPKNIIKTEKQLISQIKHNDPSVEIFLLSAKPSPSRWNLQKKYEVYNQLQDSLSKTLNRVYFINLWNVMLNPSGKPKKEIFLSDSLHMNNTGYVLWKKQIDQSLKQLKTNK